MLVKHQNFGQKIETLVYFWVKIEIFVKNRNFDQKSKFWSKNQNFPTLLQGQCVRKEDQKRVVVMIYELFKNPVTRSVVLKMFFLWMVIVMYYFALLLGDLPGSVIVNNAVNGAMEGVGALLAIIYITKKWFLRTKSIMILLLISGVVTLGAALFTYLYETQGQDESYRKVLLALSFFGFLTMSAVFAILFVYTGEMFPTVIRASSFAICSLGGRFGSLIAPQINKLTYWIPGLHGVVFTVLTFIGAYIW